MTVAEITCPKYEPNAGSRRCRHYLDNGGCARPDELMCVEWLKRNPNPAPATPPAEPTPLTTTQVLAVRTLTDEALESFRALGVEVCLTTDGAGPVWIVPEYTSRERRELRVDHAATLAALSSAFPGARVVSFGPSAGR